jgi:putative ABC transport system permease protein
MGRLLLICRLAARDLRRHRAEAVLLLLAVTTATTVLTLGLVLQGVTSHPYQQTRAATHGPDIVAYLQTPAQATKLVHDAGVTAHSGPYPQVTTTLRFGRLTAGVEAEGRSQALAAVDQPELTAGRWVRPGGVVIERAFAEALGAAVGDPVTVNGRSFTVAGIAVTAAKPSFPNICEDGSGGCYLYFNGIGAKDTGLIWMTEPDVTTLGVANQHYSYVLNLTLSDPAGAPAFATSYGFVPSAGASTGGPGHHRGHSGLPAPPAISLAVWQEIGPHAGPVLATWEEIAASDGLLIADEQAVLVPGTVLLALLAIASVAVLVGGRLAENNRRVGLLKAVGGTPGLVAATFLAENLFLAAIAAAAGLAVGWLAAPLLTSPGAALVGTPGAPSLTPSAVLEVVAVALVVALFSTLVPAIRAARSSTVSALADMARTPGRHGRLIDLSRRLPVPMLFGLRLTARRPRRALLSAASTAVTVLGIVAVLAFHATVSGDLSGQSGAGGLANPVVDRDGQLLTVITVVLVILAALNVVLTAWATVLDARRASAIMRALGANSGQVRAGLATAQVMSALPGAIVGVPLGIVVFKALAGGGTASPSALWLAITVLGTLLAVAGLTAIPARVATRQPAAVTLQAVTT